MEFEHLHLYFFCTHLYFLPSVFLNFYLVPKCTEITRNSGFMIHILWVCTTKKSIPISKRVQIRRVMCVGRADSVWWRRWNKKLGKINCLVLWQRSSWLRRRHVHAGLTTWWGWVMVNGGYVPSFVSNLEENIVVRQVDCNNLWEILSEGWVREVALCFFSNLERPVISLCWHEKLV